MESLSYFMKICRVMFYSLDKTKLKLILKTKIFVGVNEKSKCQQKKIWFLILVFGFSLPMNRSLISQRTLKKFKSNRLFRQI